MGLQDEADVEIGPLISDRQRNRVASFVERAQMAGHMEITAGGKAAAPGGGGFFYEPTVMAGARQEDEIVKREVFGPVVSVTRFTDAEQAVAWANDSATTAWPRRCGPRTWAARCAWRAQLQLRLHLDQHPLHARQRDAARRPEEQRLRQGHEHVRAGGLHRARGT